MAGSIKLIKRRIRSIASTAKLTKAMQMIAAANMRKAVYQTRLAKPFATESITFLNRFSRYIAQNKLSHPYLEEKPLQRVLGVVITSNRGLCGNYHSQLEKKILQVVNNPATLIEYPLDTVGPQGAKHQGQIEFEWLVLGRKGERIIRRLDQPIITSFTTLNEKVDEKELGVVYQMIKDAFDSGKYQKVIVFYTQHINSLRQEPSVGQLLPISTQEIQRVVDSWQINFNDFTPRSTTHTNYLIEPGRGALLDTISLLLLKTLLYYFVLESKASVESARMMAMKNASDSATEMGQLLTLAYNQLRQSKITNEIAEISAGRAALE